MGYVLVAEQQTEHFENAGLAVVPFVGVCYAVFLGYAGAEAEYKPAQHVVLVVYWTEYFAVRAVGALAE